MLSTIAGAQKHESFSNFRCSSFIFWQTSRTYLLRVCRSQVSNLSPEADEKKLREFFAFCGNIESIRFELSLSGPSGTASAIVTFENPAAVQTALLLQRCDSGCRNVPPHCLFYFLESIPRKHKALRPPTSTVLRGSSLQFHVAKSHPNTKPATASPSCPQRPPSAAAPSSLTARSPSASCPPLPSPCGRRRQTCPPPGAGEVVMPPHVYRRRQGHTHRITLCGACAREPGPRSRRRSENC